ncbi:hypothetical protein ASF36_09810 [Methylobacterium sp. Leaf90]|nr:hypothetical protein ASF36_09810 [Methylobacterium sp. Leaf90]
MGIPAGTVVVTAVTVEEVGTVMVADMEGRTVGMGAAGDMVTPVGTEVGTEVGTDVPLVAATISNHLRL